MKKQINEVDIDVLAPSEVEKIGQEIGKQIGKLGDAAAKKMNKITEVYGVKTKVYVQLIDAKTGQPI